MSKHFISQKYNLDLKGRDSRLELTKNAEQRFELDRLSNAGLLATDLGLRLHAGHGLTYQNVIPVAQIPHMHELNIGHSIVSRAVFVGFQTAVKEMKDLIRSVT